MKLNLSKFKLNTSNRHKLEEFYRLGLHVSGVTNHDLPEPDADPLIVIRHKATAAGEFVFVEDTSLDVAGADLGVNIRWLQQELPRYVGRRAVFSVLLATRILDNILVYSGVVRGTIVSPRGRGMGFDAYFQPVGSNKTLAEDKPDKYNARALATHKVVRGDRPDYVLPILSSWDGKMQH